MHRMDWARGILWILHLREFLPLRDFLPRSALHPRRRARGRGIIRGRGGPMLITLGGTRLYLMVGPAHAGDWIVLTDQPREFSQRIAFGPCRRVLAIATIMVVVRWKRSILISISHSDDAALRESRQPTPTNELAPARCPHRSPCERPSPLALSHLGRSVDAKNGKPRC